MIIETERLILRPFASADYPAWKAAYEHRLPPQNKFDVGKIDISAYDEKWFSDWAKNHAAIIKADSLYVLGAFEKRSKALVGTVEVTILVRDAEFSWGFIGYSVHNQFWGRGFATEAVKAFSAFCLETLKLTRLEIVCEMDNLASEKVATNCGYEFECVRKRFLREGNEQKDVKVFCKNAD